jgi:nucleoside-diphosphate-sugar epimerase
MSRILVTGSGGFIGKVLVGALKKKHEVICLERSTGSDKSLKYVVGDILDDNTLKSIPPVDVVIHLAAIKQHYADKEQMYHVNVDGTAKLLKNVKCKQFIFSSTIVAVDPQDDYGKTKSLCEKMIKDSKVNFTILRFSPIFGKGDNTNITKIVDTVKKYPLVPIIGNGKKLMQPLFIDDCVKIIEAAVLNKNAYKKTYFAVGQLVSLNDFVKYTEQSLGVKRIKIHVPVWLLRPFVYLLSKIFSRPFITQEQINNFEREVTFDSLEMNHDLKFYPSSFIETIKKSV